MYVYHIYSFITSGPSYSKLMMLLVNETLKFQIYYTQKHTIFAEKM